MAPYRERKQSRLWHDYGPTLAAEELAELHGVAMSRETLRKWRIEAKLWRARRARYGELLQWDTSELDWLEGREGRGEKLYLFGMIDDATSPWFGGPSLTIWRSSRWVVASG